MFVSDYERMRVCSQSRLAHGASRMRKVEFMNIDRLASLWVSLRAAVFSWGAEIDALSLCCRSEEKRAVSVTEIYSRGVTRRAKEEIAHLSPSGELNLNRQRNG